MHALLLTALVGQLTEAHSLETPRNRNVEAVCFVLDQVIVARYDRVEAYRRRDFKQLHSLQCAGAIPGLAAFPAQKCFATAETDGKEKHLIAVRDLKTGRTLRTIKNDSWPVLAAFHRRPYAAVAGRKAIRVLDITNGKEVFALPGAASDVTALALSLDDKLLAVIKHSRWRSAIELWSVEKKQRLHVLKCPDRPKSISFDASGKWLAANFLPGQVIRWDARAGAVENRWNAKITTVGQQSGQVAFSPANPNLLAIAGQLPHGMGVVLWDCAKQEVVARYQIAKKNDLIFALAFSADGKSLAVSTLHKLAVLKVDLKE